MDHRDHVELLRAGVRAGGRWADLGSGGGAFTLALAELLGPAGSVVSVDQDRRAVDQQRDAMSRLFPATAVDYRVSDFTRGIDATGLDGIVMANSLHFVRDKLPVLQLARDALAPGGALILVEYDADRGNPWVPHPLSLETWKRLAVEAGFGEPVEIGRRPSRFLGSIYSALSPRD